MGKAFWVGVGALVVATAGVAQGAILLTDDFEYADQTAFNANWVLAGTAPVVWGTEQASSPTHSVKGLTTATRSSRTFTESTVPTDAEPIIFRVSFYDSNGTAAAYRQYAELIDGAGTSSLQLIALGLNNNLSSTKYMARIVGVDGGTGTASAFFKLDGTGSPNRSTGWHTLEAKIFNNSIEFKVDNVLSKTVTYASTLTDRSYEKVRVGSNLSAGQVAYFDDVYVERVPEPATLLVIGLGSLAMLHRRRAA